MIMIVVFVLVVVFTMMMGGNKHASMVMGTNAMDSAVRNVSNKTVVREFQATILQLHLHFFNSPDDYRAKDFAKHGPSTPIEPSLLQAYASYMADHLVAPCAAGMERLVYILEGYSDGKHLPNGAAKTRNDLRAKEYTKCTSNVEGADWRKCFGVHDCAAKAIMLEVSNRKTKCPVFFIVPPGEADSFLAEAAKDKDNIVCVDSNDGDIGTLFWNPNDEATLHYNCKWSVPQVGFSGKVTLYSKITTPAKVFSKKTMFISKANPAREIDFSKWSKLKMMSFCIAVSVKGDYISGKYTFLFVFLLFMFVAPAHLPVNKHLKKPTSRRSWLRNRKVADLGYKTYQHYQPCHGGY